MIPLPTAPAIPSWGVQPLVAPDETSAQREHQWQNFKQHVGNWVGDWTFYDASAIGAPIRHAHSSRTLRLEPPTGDPTCPEVAHQTNTLKEQLPGTADSQKFFLHSATTPPLFVVPVDEKGNKSPQYPGSFLFAPIGGGIWVIGQGQSSLCSFYSERLILHPHVPGARLSVGIVLVRNGVKKIWMVREEDVPSREHYAQKNVYTTDLDATPLADGAARREAATGRGYTVVEHSFDMEVDVTARVFEADHLPDIPTGPGRIAVSLPDQIDISLPTVAEDSLFAQESELHVRWALDRGTVLHTRSLFDKNGRFIRDSLALYYPKGAE